MNSLSFLDRTNTIFPSPEKALTDPNGLLAIGGDLTPERLISAYYQGIFPWFNQEDPILWWSPDPRAVFIPGKLHTSRSLKKSLKKKQWRITINNSFSNVVKGCAAPRENQQGTWITADIYHAYQKLHEYKQAHSIEIWDDNELIGGLYGLAIGQVFCGESMFHKKTDASKVAMFALEQHLIKWNFKLIDAQIMNPHLQSLGAMEVSRKAFLKQLNQYKQTAVSSDCWIPQEVNLELK